MINTTLVRYSKEMSDADCCELAYFLSHTKPDLSEYEIRKNYIGGLGSFVRLTYGNIVVILEDCFDFKSVHDFGVGHCYVYLGGVEYVLFPKHEEKSVSQRELHAIVSSILEEKRRDLKFNDYLADQLKFFRKKTFVRRLQIIFYKLKSYFTL